MEPNSSRIAEAERWLCIAEKLLTTRDLVGSKTFAIRAREAEPRLDFADRILAVADTLIAGDKRINEHRDWYAILQLSQLTHSSELIATQYRRLALLLNPIRNRLAFADEAFRLVAEAWSVLSNPFTKSLYDNEVNLFTKLDPFSATGSGRVQATHEPQPHFSQPPPPPPPPPPPQQQENVRESPRNDTDIGMEKNVTEDSGTHDAEDETSTFWTACPYCYNMYEYPRVYVDCTLRCQNCRRAFHAAVIPSPPPISDGKEGDAYFCCWGFFPLGVSAAYLEKNKGKASNWTPFSPMFTCPQAVEHQNNAAVPKPKNSYVRKSSAPRVYIDDEDDDVFVEISGSSDDSDDDDWGSARKKKKAKKVKGKGSSSKIAGKQQLETRKNVQVDGGLNLQDGSAMQEGMGVPKATNTQAIKKAVASHSRKRTGNKAKDLGKLDLNVEFSNEVEEPVPGTSEGNEAGHGQEDGIEGTGFFEGLDEFLSSLPILSVVGDDKVKATQ